MYISIIIRIGRNFEVKRSIEPLYSDWGENINRLSKIASCLTGFSRDLHNDKVQISQSVSCWHYRDKKCICPSVPGFNLNINGLVVVEISFVIVHALSRVVPNFFCNLGSIWACARLKLKHCRVCAQILLKPSEIFLLDGSTHHGSAVPFKYGTSLSQITENDVPYFEGLLFPLLYGSPFPLLYGFYYP